MVLQKNERKLNAVEMRSFRRIEISIKDTRGSSCKSMRNPRRACIKMLMTVDEAKEVCTVMFGAPFSLTTPLGIQREAKLSYNEHF